MKRKLSSAGKVKLRQLSNRLFADCENVTDAKAAREGADFLERIILAREALNVGEPLILKDLQPGQSTPEALAPHLHVLLAQARGLIRARHHHCINQPRLDQEAGLLLMGLVPSDKYPEMGRLLAAATKE